ncbi:MAG: glycoside hydrolase family 3 protein [Balneola sp.]|nr:glycoside hydrolase family 3 protein [Balneola sp.]MBO6649563.1 glycoside hydrolase family 3 protein [Balneola sp.]MBO6711380.1 glycoside hydrolase family 3 protein [Balneola sp.]MBO6801266.1 glycoside hydrolase family 3 protein [Balneola sp.]MBO6869316.1 glycoside hydrolase family 3 protein [Balneola sp.]
MNKSIYKFQFLILVTVLFINSCSPEEPAEKKPSFTDKQLGQMLVVGFRGTEINSESPIVRDIKERNLGGVILYSYDYLANSYNRNIDSPDQLLQLNSALVGYSLNPPFISVEHDGSEYSALHNLYPSMENIFEQNSFSDTLKVINNSRRFAQEFMVVGINTNLHPRLDLKTKESSDAPLISSDPQKVTEISNLILDEYDTEKLLSVPKYFPGYTVDYNPTDSTDNITSSWSEDFLTPYKNLFEQRTIRAIQVSHATNAHIDSSWPGTFSHSTVSGLLRDSLGFEGVVFSDDLQKPIINLNYDLETSILQSINAGVDVLVFGNNFKYDEAIAQKAIAIIQKLLKEGKIKPETIEAALKRIDQLKQDVIAELCTCLTT